MECESDKKNQEIRPRLKLIIAKPFCDCAIVCKKLLDNLQRIKYTNIQQSRFLSDYLAGGRGCLCTVVCMCVRRARRGGGVVVALSGLSIEKD